MSHCVRQRTATARTKLDAIERVVREAVARSKEDANYLKPVQDKFDASVKSYRQYRNDQCKLQGALAAIGNGATEIEWACEAELDVNRTEELKAGLWWLKY
ncbi:MAG: lysozyme inhibitor LprI family protein [Thiobacillaceae bacterium]